MKMKQILIVALATVVSGSCLKHSDPVFQLGAQLVLFQEITPATSGETSENLSSYIPYIQVGSSDVMLSCSCTHPSIGTISLSKQSDTYWRSTSPANAQTTSIPVGSFTITGTSANQSVDSDVISIVEGTEGMTTKLESTLSYNPTTREVSATFNTVTGATVYGIYLIQKEYFLFQEVRGYTADQMQLANGSVKVELPEGIKEYAENEYYLVAYAAKIGNIPIVQLGARALITQ
jgi:hypothetical protein